MAKRPKHTMETLKAACAARGWKIKYNQREYKDGAVDHRRIGLVAVFPCEESSGKRKERACERIIDQELGVERLGWGIGEWTNEDGGDFNTLTQELFIPVAC